MNKKRSIVYKGEWDNIQSMIQWVSKHSSVAFNGDNIIKNIDNRFGIDSSSGSSSSSSSSSGSRKFEL